MGEVALTINVMPEDMEKFESVKQAIVEKMKNDMGGLVKRLNMSEKDIAFGMKAIVASVVIPDGEGGADKVEASLGEIEGVSSVEIVGMDRL
ncbi:MAG: elongation factor 1-beta [Candidatus Micrarchaeota archaeon]